jgi:hypothetical protein
VFGRGKEVGNGWGLEKGERKIMGGVWRGEIRRVGSGGMIEWGR